MRTFRFLAFVNVACSIILLGSAALAGLAGIVGAGDASAFQLLFMACLAILLGLIALTMYRSARAHLRTPTQRTALVIAANSAVLLWFLLHGIFNAAMRERSIDPIYGIVSLLVAWFSYRIVLKPTVLRAFPADAKNA